MLLGKRVQHTQLHKQQGRRDQSSWSLTGQSLTAARAAKSPGNWCCSCILWQGVCNQNAFTIATCSLSKGKQTNSSDSVPVLRQSIFCSCSLQLHISSLKVKFVKIITVSCVYSFKGSCGQQVDVTLCVYHRLRGHICQNSCDKLLALMFTQCSKLTVHFAAIKPGG